MEAEKHMMGCRVVIEMMGGPKKHIEETLKIYVDKIEEEYKKKIRIKERFISPAKKQKDSKMYNIFAELDLEIDGIENIMWFCFDYMPASVEIYDPEEFVYTDHDMTAFLNDLLAKLHKVDMTIKHLAAENQVLGKNGVTLLKNIIIIQLKTGPKTAEALATEAGVPVDHIKRFLDVMEKEGKVKKKGKEYIISS